MSSPKTHEQLEEEKQTAAQAAVRYVRSGMFLGLGTGSTAAYFVEFLAEAIRRDDMKIRAVASSLQTQRKAKALGITVSEPQRGARIDLAVDGTDEVAPDLSLIKGAGGALLREKIVARRSKRFVIIADSSKRVSQLGCRPVPLEVVPFAVPWVMDDIADLGGRPVLRVDKSAPDQPFLTDQHNHLLDCDFGLITDPAGLAVRLREIPGVVEHGLFLGLTHAAIVAEGREATLLRPWRSPVPLSETSSVLD